MKTIDTLDDRMDDRTLYDLDEIRERVGVCTGIDNLISHFQNLEKLTARKLVYIARNRQTQCCG